MRTGAKMGSPRLWVQEVREGDLGLSEDSWQGSSRASLHPGPRPSEAASSLQSQPSRRSSQEALCVPRLPTPGIEGQLSFLPS